MSAPSVLGIIPARGNSKGLPRKVLAEVGGMSLVARAVSEAKKSRLLSRVIVSTEDEEIAEEARQYGAEVPFLRPEHLAADDVTNDKVGAHLLSALPEHYDYVALLQPTSPFRLACDIDAVLERCIANDADACVSVSRVSGGALWLFSLENECLRAVLPPEMRQPQRQNAPEIYRLNGMVYVVKAEVLARTGRFFQENSLACAIPGERDMDIDTLYDLEVARVVVNMLAKAK